MYFFKILFILDFFCNENFCTKKKLLLEHAAKAVYRNEGYNFCIKKLLLEHVKNSSINVKGRGQKNHTFLEKKRAGDSRLDLLKIKYIVF